MTNVNLNMSQEGLLKDAVATLSIRLADLEEQVAQLRAAIQPAEEPADQLAAGFEQFRKRARKAAHGE